VLASATIMGLKTTDTTSRRLSGSVDRQLLARYFVTDVQSSSDVNLTDTACGGAPSGGYAVVRLKWSDPVTSVATTASYVVETVNNELVLSRRRCLDPS